MRTRFRSTLPPILLSFPLICFAAHANAASKKEGRITALVNDVVLISPHAETRPVAVNDELPRVATVRTGADSRAEITFGDQAITRLWADTVLGIKKGVRDLELGSGVVLVQMPRGVKGKLRANGVAAAISDATVMFECHSKVFKFLVLQGIGRLYRPGHLGDSVLVHPGQMVIGNPKSALSDPVDFDIGHFLKTSRLLLDFPPLRSESSMVAESEKQQREKSKKVLIDTNLVIFGGGTRVSIVDPKTNFAPAPRTSASPGPAAMKTQ
jgi:FecR protein